MIRIAIIKTEGENRERGADNRLHATQKAKYAAVIISPAGHIGFFGSRRPSITHAKRAAEDVFGPLEWQGYPDYAGLTGEKWKHVHAVAEVRAR